MKANVNFAIFMFLTVLCGMADGRIISEYREIPDEEVQERKLEELLVGGHGRYFQRIDGTFLRQAGIAAYKVRFHFNESGRLHRDYDLPAVERVNDYGRFSACYEWYKDGKRHRLNAPAIEYFDIAVADNHKEYWIEDFRYPEDAFNNFMDVLKHRSVEGID